VLKLPLCYGKTKRKVEAYKELGTCGPCLYMYNLDKYILKDGKTNCGMKFDDLIVKYMGL
jgi:hypothetical protein